MNAPGATHKDEPAAVYDLLRVDTLDMAREPANQWPIIVKKEQGMSAEQQSPPAAPTPGVNLEGLATELKELRALFQAEIAVKKEANKPKAQAEVTFRRGEQSQILVAKQTGALGIAQLQALAEMARPALAHLEEVTVAFVPGVEMKMDTAPAGDAALLAVQKETNAAVAKLGERFDTIEKALKVVKSTQAPSDAQTHSTPGAGDTPSVEENPEAYLPPSLRRKG